MMLNLHSEPTLPYVCRRIRGWKKCSTVFPYYKNILSYFQRKWKRRSNLILGQAGKQMMLAVPAGIVGQSQQDGLLMIRAPVLTRNVDPLKGSVSRDFRLIFFSWFKPTWAPDKQSKVFLNLISIRYLTTKLEKFDSAVCMAPRSQILGLVRPLFMLQIFSFMTDVFTPKSISPDFPLKATRDQQNFWMHTTIVWLRGGIHKAEFFEKYGSLPSSVWCTQQSLTPRRDEHCTDPAETTPF